VLVLSRKIGERIVIGDNISVVISRVAGNRVTLGIEAPSGVRIVRGELRPQFEVEVPAEALAQGHAPRAVDPPAERRVDHQLHATRIVEEALENQVLLRRQDAERGVRGGQVAYDLFGHLRSYSGLFLQKRSSAHRFVAAQAFADLAPQLADLGAAEAELRAGGPPVQSAEAWMTWTENEKLLLTSEGSDFEKAVVYYNLGLAQSAKNDYVSAGKAFAKAVLQSMAMHRHWERAGMHPTLVAIGEEA